MFTDLHEEPDREGELLDSLHELMWRGNEIILFHILDAAEVDFPYRGQVHFTDRETGEVIAVDAQGLQRSYLERIATFRKRWETDCGHANIDYVPLDTGTPFDKALISYLLKRKDRF